VPVTGMPNGAGEGFVDYVLWGANGKPLGVVEAKRSFADPEIGRQQAKLYADCLEKMKGQRPLIFYANGHKTWLWDDRRAPPREVQGFYTRAELEQAIGRRQLQEDPRQLKIDTRIVERAYQHRAIRSMAESLVQGRRAGLLTMATGSGKTRVAIALVDLLMRANWVKRVLFLADRRALVKQATNAFKAHLPNSSPVNLVLDRHGQGRVYLSTYPTMMGLIEEMEGRERKYGIGHFDLIIIDEAHRSVYQKFGAIFRYFDSYLVGLTATPRDEVDRDTCDRFLPEPAVGADQGLRRLRRLARQGDRAGWPVGNYFVFAIAEGELPSTLIARQDMPTELPMHRSIEPRVPCSFAFRNEILGTRQRWRIAHA